MGHDHRLCRCKASQINIIIIVSLYIALIIWVMTTGYADVRLLSSSFIHREMSKGILY